MAVKRELVWDESGILSHYFSDKVGTPLTVPSGFVTLADGEMTGAVAVYDIVRGKKYSSGMIIGASNDPRVFTRKNLRDMCRMFFRPAPYGMGLTRLTSTVAVSNKHSINITKRLGFVKEGVLREASDEGEDMIISSLLAKDDYWGIGQEDDPQKASSNKDQEDNSDEV